MPPMITVVPGPNVRAGEVAIWERHAAHPDGELYVAHGDGPTLAAPTSLVSDRISKGRLLQVIEPSAPAAAAPEPDQGVPPDTDQQTTTDTGQEPPADPLDAPGLLTQGQRDALAAAGFVTAADVRTADDAALAAVNGIGLATIARLREATKEQ